MQIEMKIGHKIPYTYFYYDFVKIIFIGIMKCDDTSQ